jgi:Tol biopolymer transport system component
MRYFIKQVSNPCLWIAVSGLLMLGACSSPKRLVDSSTLNSRYTDEQPALSGNGRLVAFTTNRNGKNQIALYDLQLKQFVELPGINRANVLLDSPSLSRTGRYLVYITSEGGKPQIALYDRAISEATVLTKNYRNWVRNPRISPDGRYVVFETSRRGQWDIEVLDRGDNIELDLPDGVPLENE